MQWWRGWSQHWAGPGSWQYEFHQYLTRTTHAVQPLSMVSGPQSPSEDPLNQIKWRTHLDRNHTLKKKTFTNPNSRGRIHRCQHWRRLWWPFLCSLSTLRCELSATSKFILILPLTTPKPTEQEYWIIKHIQLSQYFCVLCLKWLTWQKPFIFSRTLLTSGITSLPSTIMGLLERFLRATWSTARPFTPRGNIVKTCTKTCDHPIVTFLVFFLVQFCQSSCLTMAAACINTVAFQVKGQEVNSK